MGFFDVFFAGVGLAMDAVAIGMTNGMEHPNAKWKKILQIALLFGLFQAVMPLGGYFLAKGAASVSKELFEKETVSESEIATLEKEAKSELLAKTKEKVRLLDLHKNAQSLFDTCARKKEDADTARVKLENAKNRLVLVEITINL